MNQNNARTANVRLDLDLNVHMIKALQSRLDCDFNVARGRLRAALRNTLLDILPDMTARIENDGSVSVGFNDEDGFGNGDERVIDASFLWGRNGSTVEVD